MLTLTLGCMYAGKTSKLMSDVNACPGLVIDYDTNQGNTLMNHDQQTMTCLKTKHLIGLDINHDVIYINEAQFFQDLVPFVKQELSKHKHVHVYGLDGDFKQEMFGTILELIPLCDSYIKLHAICNCGRPAPFSKRLSTNMEQYSPHDQYVPSCRQCL